MNTDDRVQLAEKLASELAAVSSNEWKKWSEYVSLKTNLEAATRLASGLYKTGMLRPEPRESYRTIFTVVTRHLADFKSMPLAELLEIFGYTFRVLKYREEVSKTDRAGGRR